MSSSFGFADLHRHLACVEEERGATLADLQSCSTELARLGQSTTSVYELVLRAGLGTSQLADRRERSLPW